MANKFVLIPEEIYKNLTAPITGGPTNLEFVKKSLENVLNERANPTEKNVHYNQELRRYLHLLKEQDKHPMAALKTSGDQSGTAAGNSIDQNVARFV